MAGRLTSLECQVAAPSIYLVILHITYVSMQPTVFQPVRTEWVPLGDSVTFQCSCMEDALVTVLWLKQTPENGLVTILTIYYEDVKYKGHFVNVSRFELQMDKVSFNLTIRNVSLTDVGSYHCGVIWYNEYYFGKGAYLKIQVNESTKVIITNKTQGNLIRLTDIITYLLVVIIVILLITNILPVILWRRNLQKDVTMDISPTDQNQSTDTQNYAALNFSGKRSEHRNGRGHGRDELGPNVVYAAIK
ncbi:hypothetical protein DPEC_G00104070 [Dallia pectoralis]|uniref:Uncharacterized protein n=1 Tax=Dallia pectoralis TaxID=75939 RepID=A0ACC2GYB4_DALPE|nr:hypothetical protein DPEC_G00104070 [Dallia pectoralis]